MGEVKRVVSNLVQMLEAGQREAAKLVSTMHALHSYLEQESKTIIQEGLDRLLITARAEATKITGGRISRWPVVVLISPEGTVTVKEIYGDENSDPWLARLKAEGFQVMTLHVFSSLIQSLKSEVVKGNFIPVIEFLRANTKIGSAQVYLPATPLREIPPHEPSSSVWKLSDFLPAKPPYPPLPRGLFKD